VDRRFRKLMHVLDLDLAVSRFGLVLRMSTHATPTCSPIDDDVARLHVGAGRVRPGELFSLLHQSLRHFFFSCLVFEIYCKEEDRPIGPAPTFKA
jgi:hypothetical protein